jgi:hypothetical protein
VYVSKKLVREVKKGVSLLLALSIHARLVVYTMLFANRAVNNVYLWEIPISRFDSDQKEVAGMELQNYRFEGQVRCVGKRKVQSRAVLSVVFDWSSECIGSKLSAIGGAEPILLRTKEPSPAYETVRTKCS